MSEQAVRSPSSSLDKLRQGARKLFVEQGLDNVRLNVAGGEALPEKPTYDFVITFDCIHDMTRPGEVISSIRRSLKDEGTWLIKDIRSHPDFRENLRNPFLAMFYGFSVSACMSSALDAGFLAASLSTLRGIMPRSSTLFR